ncbi:MAG: hypothetical protein JWO86_391 [Myxococcaceae bacterium]|jgi:hypothetical protein|nr:hypothetical protein [Myxococcaceae bacterium]MEA2752185.1 hypothetical protein [Myxococcales bacterium]
MRSLLTFATAALATLLATSSASAEDAGGAKGVDWSRVVADFDRVARQGADVLDSPRCATSGCETSTNATAAAPERGFKLNVQDTTNDLLAFRPMMSLVARDWNSSFRVAGDRLALIDAMRLTTSTRMVLARVRMSDARIAPFAQVGLGQWRTDPFVLPLTPRYEEIAAQATGGVELRLMGSWQVALETTTTMLYREQQQSTRDLPSAHMWSTTFASRFDF